MSELMDQSELVEAFAAGRIEGVSGAIERVRTHLSEIFLSGDRAFKLKRAVKLPFVDFRSIESRRAACEAELAVNQRMAAPLYLGVSPITRAGEGRLRIGGAGRALDWVVVMRRFDSDQQFDRLAASGRLTLALIEGAARAVAKMHAGAPVEPRMGRVDDYRFIISKLRETDADGASRLGVETVSSGLFEALERDLDQLAPLIEERRGARKVRRVHGDLHLRNLCVFEGEPMLFDALEFDPSLATTDVVYDIAFLLMDLRRIAIPGHANAAMNAYWNSSGEDEEALALLRFFMALRAAVRMAVAMEAGDAAEAQSYQQLGLSLFQRTPPQFVAIGGLSGVGKSAVAAALAPRLAGPAGARVLRSDVIRKMALGLAFQLQAGPEAYSEQSKYQTYQALAARAAKALGAGVSVVADATFQSPASRSLIEAAAAGARFHGVWLDAPLSVRLARIKGRRGDPSDADAAIAVQQEPPRGLYWSRVNACGDVAGIAEQIWNDCGIASV